MAKEDVVDILACSGPCADGEGLWLLWEVVSSESIPNCGPCLKGFVEYCKDTEPGPWTGIMGDCYQVDCTNPAQIFISFALAPESEPLPFCYMHVGEFVDKVERRAHRLLRRQGRRRRKRQLKRQPLRLERPGAVLDNPVARRGLE